MQNKRLSIVYIDFDDIQNPLLGAGQAVATYQLGKRLVSRGHTLTVLCSKYPGYKDRIQDGIHYKHIGLGTRFIRLNNAAFFCAAPLVVRKIKNTDVIIECFTAPISTLFSPLFTNIPVIAMPSMFNAREFSRVYKLPFHIIEKWGMKLYSYMLPYSEVDAKKAVSLQPTLKYKIVPQGATEEYFHITRTKPKHILYLGRLDMWQKGLDLLIQAYKKIQPRVGYPLVIAGHGPDEEKIKNIIREEKLEGSIKLIGSTYGEKKIDVMREAICVVFPSRHDEMCLWTLEALAGALPHVIFDLPESAWIDSKAAFKAKPFDVDDFASKILEILPDEVNERMSNEARKLARSYSWDSVVLQFESFVYEVLQIEKSKHDK